MPERPIPAFVNPESGTGRAAWDALLDCDRFAVQTCAPDALPERIVRAVENGAMRIVVAGGDGTVAAGAAALAGSRAELAVVPGGTLNHFARTHGIPTAPAEAATAAVSGDALTVDVAYVNDRLFLNTSSVGAYAVFVRARERLERRFGYRLATVLAALRLLGRIRPFTLELELDGVAHRYRSALVFVAVGEREFRLPSLGRRAQDGRRGLHVIVVHGGTWARLAAIGLAAVLGGSRAMERRSLAESFIVDRCRIELRHPHGRVAVDGELVELPSPLEYRLARDALRVVVPRHRE